MCEMQMTYYKVHDIEEKPREKLKLYFERISDPGFIVASVLKYVKGTLSGRERGRFMGRRRARYVLPMCHLLIRESV